MDIEILERIVGSRKNYFFLIMNMSGGTFIWQNGEADFLGLWATTNLISMGQFVGPLNPLMINKNKIFYFEKWQIFWFWI